MVCPLEAQQMNILQSLFNPLESDNQDDMGVELYIAAREFVNHCNSL